MNRTSQLAPTGKRRPERVEQILDVAVDLFYEVGYHQASIIEIGQAAGLSAAGIYRHYRNKEQILEAAMQRAGVQVLARLSAHRAVGDPRHDLEVLVAQFVDAVVGDPKLAAMLVLEYRSLGPVARGWIDEARRLHAVRWVHPLRQMRRELSVLQATLLATAVINLITGYATDPTLLDVPDAAELLRSAAMAAFEPGRAAPVPETCTP